MREALGRPTDPIDGRLRLIGVLAALVFCVFALRLFQLQIIEGDELRERSERNSVRTVRLDPPRGEIVDREGRVVASTRAAYAVEIVPSDLRSTDLELAALGQLLDREPEKLAAALGDPRGARRFQPVRLDDDLDFDRLARVETHRFALPGVVTRVRPRRSYLEGAFAAHLLGTLGEVRADQLERPEFAGYRPGDVVGQTGLEARYERHLHGRAGGRNVLVDAAGREVELLDEVPPVPGGRLVLALDVDLQRAAEAAFDDVPEGQPSKMGAAIALDVNDGDVLAFVSRPAFDPNSFAGGIDRDTWKSLTEDEWEPLQDRAIQNHYPPGSTHKGIMAAALLAEGVITRETRAFCPGFFRFGNRVYRCWKHEGHGWVNVVDALKRSCDVFFYTYGVQLGIDRMAHWAKAFGLGSRTGIGLGPESPGLVPSTEWKRKRFGEPWYPGETVSASIGQGYYLYTPLQLAVAYAAIANGGKVMKPRMVLRLEDESGKVMEEVAPEVVSRAEVTPEVIEVVHEGLRAVVMEPGGTANGVRIPGVSIAGKTGTAQVVGIQHTEGLDDRQIPIRQRDHGWFVAYAPAENPEIAVAVFIEHGLHGSSAAGPVAKKIFEAWWKKRSGEAPAVAAGG